MCFLGGWFFGGLSLRVIFHIFAPIYSMTLLESQAYKLIRVLKSLISVATFSGKHGCPSSWQIRSHLATLADAKITEILEFFCSRKFFNPMKRDPLWSEKDFHPYKSYIWCNINAWVEPVTGEYQLRHIKVRPKKLQGKKKQVNETSQGESE